MDGMRIELLVVPPDCPHEAAAAELLTSALEDVGLGSAGYTVTVIAAQADADRRHFIGSLTFSVDGDDIFAEPGRPASVACRIYALEFYAIDWSDPPPRRPGHDCGAGDRSSSGAGA
jgi:hypothetical protein